MLTYEYTLIDVTADDYNETSQHFTVEVESKQDFNTLVMNHIKSNFNPLMHKLTALRFNDGIKTHYASYFRTAQINHELSKEV